MAHYAVMRIAKLKTMGDVASLGLHNERERGTPNADPELTAHNIRLAGSGDWVADVQSRLDDVERIRVNAVLAIEHVLSASRTWFTEAPAAQQNMWMEQSMQWLRDTYGTPNVVAAVLHIDEITPHIQALVVPIDERGHLNAREFIGGSRSRLAELQDSYAEAVAGLGLERGVRGSVAEHQTIKEFYARLDEPTCAPLARSRRTCT